MDENVDLPFAAPYGAFEFTCGNQTCNKLRISIVKRFGSHEDQPRATSSALVLVLMISLLKPFSALATHFDYTSFDFPSFGSESLQLLDIQGNASVLSPDLHLGRSRPNQFGQARYSEKVHLWDKTTGNEADFAARFKFSIDSQQRNACGDGFTFFVAPRGSGMSSSSGGGNLGLPENSYVAAEFDTFKNLWDGDVPHVGIDLNDLGSLAYVTVPWLTDKIMNGGSVNASITYDSRGRNLSVVLMDADGNSSNYVSLHYAPLSLSEYLPEWAEVGFSGATGAAFEYHIVHSWEFSSSLRLRAEKTTLPWWKWLLIVVGIVVGLVIVALIVAWVRNRSKVDGRYLSRKQSEIFNASRASEENKTEIETGGEEGGHSATLTEELENYGGPKKFSYEELEIATDSFADDSILGRGGFGIVYKGHIGDARTPVAVKKITSGSRQRIEEYKSEVKSLSQLNHGNLVRLIGYCHEANEFVLVYEFIRGGSLEDRLFTRRTSLTWERRYNIALGLASALHYLQKQCRRCVIHRDIKCSNVMLGENFTAILGDFGLAKLVDHTRQPNTTQVKGTPGYLAPEYYRTGKASKESDIYSLGVVLLEIVCGRRACDPDLAEQGPGLVRWVWKSYGRRSRSWRWFWNFHLLVDERLGKDFDKKQAEALVIAGLWCAHPIAESRPSIEEAMAVLKLKAEPPKLPFEMPVPDI